jgi:putative ABC transport system ATP-binding protein
MATFTKPKILLLDEHTAALDPKRAQLIVDLTRQVVEQNNLTTLMVTHNMEQALNMGNRLLMLHEGRIILDIPEEKKRKMTTKDLLRAFEEARGGEAFAEDRYMLT